MVHVVICDEKYGTINKILNGKKTMIIRAADGRKLPHSRVFFDDELYFFEKRVSKLTAKAKVTEVQNFTKLTQSEANVILEENEYKLALDESQKEKFKKKCMCLIEFDSLEKIEPIAFTPARKTEDWLMAEELSDLIK